MPKSRKSLRSSPENGGQKRSHNTTHTDTTFLDAIFGDGSTTTTNNSGGRETVANTGSGKTKTAAPGGKGSTPTYNTESRRSSRNQEEEYRTRAGGGLPLKRTDEQSSTKHGIRSSTRIPASDAIYATSAALPGSPRTRTGTVIEGTLGASSSTVPPLHSSTTTTTPAPPSSTLTTTSLLPPASLSSGTSVDAPDSPNPRTPTLSRRRWHQSEYVDRYKAEKDKLDALPGMVCTTCMVQNNCPLFDEARTSCGYSANFDAFSARDVDGILGRMEFIADDTFKRYMRSRLAEDVDEGGLPNSRTTELGFAVIQTQKELNEMRGELADDGVKETAGKKGGVLTQAISMMMEQSHKKSAKIVIQQVSESEE